MDPEFRFAGMTTLERLLDADLLEAFDAAVAARDRDRLTEILIDVGMKEQAFTTINTILANPAPYGYRR
ncbi:MAG: hypothetical protein JWR84_3943 [Caulobacter sp.]|nr:hypothetical protein [Caulobacter sp.]